MTIADAVTTILLTGLPPSPTISGESHPTYRVLSHAQALIPCQKAKGGGSRECLPANIFARSMKRDAF